MDIGTYLWTTLGAILTLAIFSFLYKDNPFYKFAEHLVVGVSAGYWAVILWHNGLVPNLLERLKDGDWYYVWLNSTRPWYVIPADQKWYRNLAITRIIVDTLKELNPQYPENRDDLSQVVIE